MNIRSSRLASCFPPVPGGLKAYGAPLPRIGITFLEILPAGVLVSLISAAVLRRPEVLSAEPLP